MRFPWSEPEKPNFCKECGCPVIEKKAYQETVFDTKTGFGKKWYRIVYGCSTIKADKWGEFAHWPHTVVYTGKYGYIPVQSNCA